MKICFDQGIFRYLENYDIGIESVGVIVHIEDVLIAMDTDICVGPGDRELRAVRAERDAEKCYAAEYMSSHLGEVHPGIVSGITNRGLFVSLANGIEGFVSLTDDEHAFFEFDGTASTRDRRSGASYSIGDNVVIQVAGASVPTGTIDFTFAKTNTGSDES